ncbi:MAG: hypothetical protein OIN83_09700 [Candidatus Methanoperedens sp.]|nr:hypothetical protein [Candidatus Methanoperedens sp.]
MKKIMLIFIGLMALSVYAMPNVVTVFANQHSFYKSSNIMCITCHSDIKDQVEIGDIFSNHKEAALNNTYTTYLAIGGISYNAITGNITVYGNHNWHWNGSVWINDSNPSQYKNETLDETGNGAIDSGELCMLCHSIASGMKTHTGSMVVTACDDDRCHGNRNNIYNDPGILGIFANVSAAGYNISSNNIHSSYYLTTSNQSSPYPAMTPFGYVHGNVYNNYVSRGYYSCLGCHSEINININLVQSQPYNHSGIDEPQGRYQ